MSSSGKSKPAIVAPAPVKFEAAGDTLEAREYNLQLVLPSPGYATLSFLVVDLLLRRVEIAVLDYSPSAVAVRYLVDGVWHPMPNMDRETGDFLLATLKQICGLNYRERRQRQEGHCKANYFEKRAKLRVISQGVPSGERVGIYVDVKKPPLDNLEQLGMRPAMRQQLTPILGANQGLVVVCAMPTEGFTTMWRATLGACDRFMRDYFVVEPQERAEREVINFHSFTYEESKGETAFQALPQLLLREPHVCAFPELVDGTLLNELCRLSTSQPMLVMTRIFSRHAVEALPRLLALKPDVKQLATNLSAIVCMRLIRKLCMNCRQAYQPAPQLLAKLGIPPHRVQYFYRPYPYKAGVLDSEGNEIPPCPECMGVGYLGRTGVFELLTMNDALRQALLTNPKVENLTTLAQAAGHVTMRDEAILLVAKGETSLEELQRVFAK